MKIAVINNLYPPFDKGGAEKIAYQQVKKLEKKKHQVFVITTKSKNQKISDQETKIFYLNSLYTNLSKINKLWRLFWHLWQFLKPQTKIIKILKKEKPDLVISHNLLGIGWRLPVVLKRLNIQHQHVLHDIQLLHPSGLILLGQENIINNQVAKVYQFLTRKIFKNTNKVISPSKWLLDIHKRKKFFESSKLEIRLNYNLENINISWPKKIKKLLFIGQLEKHKGILFLLKCAKNWEEKNYNFNLDIIGDGSLKEVIEKVTKNSSNIKYLGKINNKQINEKFKNYDCLIVPSLCYENSPTVIFEASKAGLAIIASKIGGISELKEKFNLRLFTPNNQKELENIIFF
jgi:glycosyltransferase involved in cell wall biosynthesis